VSTKKDLPISTSKDELVSQAWETLINRHDYRARTEIFGIEYIGESLEDTLILYLLGKYPLLCTAILKGESYDASTLPDLPDNLYVEWDGHGEPPDAEFVLVSRAYFTKGKQK